MLRDVRGARGSPRNYLERYLLLCRRLLIGLLVVREMTSLEKNDKNGQREGLGFSKLRLAIDARYRMIRMIIFAGHSKQ